VLGEKTSRHDAGESFHADTETLGNIPARSSFELTHFPVRESLFTSDYETSGLARLEQKQVLAQAA
jgi:hypothetical protein